VVSIISAVSIVVGFCSGVDTLCAAEIPACHHPWGCFKPGAWNLVRVVTETLDDKGCVTSTSVTETKTTLAKVEDAGVALNIDVSVEVAGKRFHPQSQTIKQDVHGEVVGENAVLKDAGAAQVAVEGRSIPCKVLEVGFAGSNTKTTTRLYHADAEYPYILKRETVTTDAEGKERLSEKTVQVVAQNMPCRVLAEIMGTSILSDVHKHPKGTMIKWTRMAPGVPGGIVEQSTKELDRDGRVLRRSMLELTEYGLEPEFERTGLFGRRHSTTRFRKVSPK
jgi:hypothetical protein